MLTVKKNNDNGMGITAPKFCEQDTLYINNKTGLNCNTKKIFSGLFIKYTSPLVFYFTM